MPPDNGIFCKEALDEIAEKSVDDLFDMASDKQTEIQGQSPERQFMSTGFSNTMFRTPTVQSPIMNSPFKSSERASDVKKAAKRQA